MTIQGNEQRTIQINEPGQNRIYRLDRNKGVDSTTHKELKGILIRYVMSLVKCFGDHKINIDKANNGEITFCGKDVANALRYVRTDQAIRKHVEVEDKILVKDLIPRFEGSGQNRQNK